MVSPISKAVAWTLNRGSSLKSYEKLEGKINRKTFDDIIAYTTIASVAAKDAVGCGMYVYQSLNNDKIPEKRRKFVSALDLTNGILMIASQVAMFFAMRKINAKLFDKIFPSFRDGAYKLFGKQIRANGKKAIEEAKAAGKAASELPDYSTVRNEHTSMKDIAFSVFKSFTELAAATIVAKRIIVPFIATPLASKVEKLMDKHHADNTEENNNTNNSNLSMKGADFSDAISAQEDNGTTNLLDIYRKNHTES